MDEQLYRDAKARAIRGARYLDEYDPTWHERVHPDVLQMDNCYNCVLGQLFENFVEGAIAVGAHVNKREIRYGFVHPWELEFSAQAGYYKALEEVWKEEISKRSSASES
jgi:hypothetical protein